MPAPVMFDGLLALDAALASIQASGSVPRMTTKTWSS